MSRKKERQAIGFRILFYALSSIISYLQGYSKTDNPRETAQYFLDTKEQKKNFFIDILVFIMEKILGLLADEETKKISKSKIAKNTLKKIL